MSAASGKKLFVACLITACALILTSADRASAADELMANFKQAHPRLILTAEMFKDTNLGGGGQKAAALQTLTAKADAMLAEPTASWRSDTMLEVSRTVLKRVTTLAYIYKVTGVPKYLKRARAEMLAAASFGDWHPAHFLDTAEMMDALALGYDWLYDDLGSDERKKIAAAIWQKGLCEAASAYDKNTEFWTRENHTNWNTVCNGSILTAALALSGKCDEDNFVCDSKSNTAPSALASGALKRFRAGLAHYEPDGCFDEGPTYWHYSTVYAARAISALSTACGGEFTCCRGSGFAHTGEFVRDMVGASGLLFNYADSGLKLHNAPELFWLAGRFGNFSLADYERSLLASQPSNVNAFDLLWWQSGTAPGQARSCSFGGNAPLVVMHGDEQSGGGFFAGLLGGDNHSHHSHLGLGNFVLDFYRQRFVKLLGPDNYDMPGYFERSKGNDSEAWKYYRNNSQGQNVITFGGLDQDADARASLLLASSNLREGFTSGASFGDVEYAVFNLNHACLRAGVATISRGLAHFPKNNAVLLQDEYQRRRDRASLSKPNLSLDWHFHTDADVMPVDGSHGRALKLTIADKSVLVRIVSPTQGAFNVQNIDLKPPQYPTTGLKKISLKVAAQSKGTIAVIFLPFTKPTLDLKYQSIKLPVSLPVPFTSWPTRWHQNRMEQN